MASANQSSSDGSEGETPEALLVDRRVLPAADFPEVLPRRVGVAGEVDLAVDLGMAIVDRGLEGRQGRVLVRIRARFLGVRGGGFVASRYSSASRTPLVAVLDETAAELADRRLEFDGPTHADHPPNLNSDPDLFKVASTPRGSV